MRTRGEGKRGGGSYGGSCRGCRLLGVVRIDWGGLRYKSQVRGEDKLQILKDVLMQLTMLWVPILELALLLGRASRPQVAGPLRL